MNNFGRLYGYELKKILKGRMVWILAAIMLLIITFSIIAELLGSYYVDEVRVDSYYHMSQMDKAYQKALSGQEVNQKLLDEMTDSYRQIPSEQTKHQTYPRPYRAILKLVSKLTGMDATESLSWKAVEDDLYAKHQAMLERSWEGSSLTQAEKNFWQQQENRVTKPLRFFYNNGWWILVNTLTTISIMTLVVIAVCLSGVFADEHTRKTDQLVLCSKLGRQTLYWAKITAGISFAAGISLLFTLFAFSLAFIVYGTDGFSSALQLVYTNYSYPLSIGQAALICYALMIAAAVLTGIFTMLLSGTLHSSIGTLTVVVGIVILSMFLNISEQYRIVSQIWSYLPSKFVAVWNIFSLWTVPLMGKHLTAWQAVPLLYAGFAALFIGIGKTVYPRYQVSGR